MDERMKRVLSELQALCSKRECCTSELYSKALKKLEGDAGGASRLVESLVGDGYADDARYCRAFAGEKSALTGWGPYKIRRALQAKSMSPETIADALESIDETRSVEKLRKLMASKWKSLKGDPQAKLKLIRFALTRGYEYDCVNALMESVCSRDDQAI